MDVEGYHVRTRHSDSIERLSAVAGKPDLKIGLRRKDLANELANESRVVDHQYFDHGFVCRLSLLRVSLLKESNRPRSARVSSSEGSSNSTIRPDASRMMTEFTKPSASPVKSGEGLIRSGVHR